MYMECPVPLSHRSGRSCALLGCCDSNHVCLRRPTGETFKVLSWLKCYCIRESMSLPPLSLSVQKKKKKKWQAALTKNVSSPVKVQYPGVRWCVCVCVWLFFLMIATDWRPSESWGCSSPFHVEWNSEKLSAGMLLVKYHLKISADIIQIYIERTPWLPQTVPLGLDSSMQGHNHSA